MLRCLLLFFIVSALFIFSSFVPAPKRPPLILRAYDSTAVSPRHFDSHALDSLGKQPAFNYHEEKQDSSGWVKFWRWFWHLFDFGRNKNFKGGGILALFLNGLFILLGVAALVLLLLKVTGVNINIFRRKAVAVGLPYQEFSENIHEINFDEQIEKAVETQNYRFAVRLLYLKCLKQLADKNLIDWQIEKTNNHYIAELDDAEKRSAFAQLTRQFEFVWYGDFNISGPIFESIGSSFKNFEKQLA
jgi:hypothetical protein